MARQRATGKTAWPRANPGRDRARARRRPGARPRRRKKPVATQGREGKEAGRRPSPSSGRRSAGSVKNRASVARMPSARPAPHKAALLSHNIYERDLDKTAGQLRAADAAAVHRAQRQRLSRPHRAGARRAPPELGRDLCALPPARLGAGEGRHRHRRHGGDHGAQHPRDVRGAFRRADDGRRAELAQHAARCGDARLHPRPQRDQGAAGRPRVSTAS